VNEGRWIVNLGVTTTGPDAGRHKRWQLDRLVAELRVSREEPVWPKNRNDGKTVGAIAPAQVWGSHLLT